MKPIETSTICRILSERLANSDRTRHSCPTGKAPCTRCTALRPSLPFDDEVRRLISSGIFKISEPRRSAHFGKTSSNKAPKLIAQLKGSGCPYYIISQSIRDSLDREIAIYFGDGESKRVARHLYPLVRVSVKKLTKAINTCRIVSRDDFLAGAEGQKSTPFRDVVLAESLLYSSMYGLKTLCEDRGGRPPNILRLSVFRGAVLAWLNLTGKFPAKNSSRFHNLASSILFTFDPSSQNLSFERATREATEWARSFSKIRTKPNL